MHHTLKIVTIIFIILLCSCKMNPVGNNTLKDMNYIKYSCGEEMFTFAQSKDSKESYTKPSSSFIVFGFGISVNTKSNDTAFSINAFSDSGAISILFPRKYIPSVYTLKKNNQDPHFKCTFSKPSNPPYSYFETPHQYNSNDSSSHEIGSIEITKIDFSECIIEARFQFWVYKYVTDIDTPSIVRPQKDSLLISDGSLRYQWTDYDIEKSFIPGSL